MIRTISTTLMQLGISPAMKGYFYLQYGLYKVCGNPALGYAVFKELYPMIASHFNESRANVERCIRHSIKCAWEIGDVDLYRELFKSSFEDGDRRPENGKFIRVLSKYIRSLNLEHQDYSFPKMR